MTVDEFEKHEDEQADAYSFLNLPPKGSREMNEMAARLGEAFMTFARLLLNVKYRQARVFTDTSDLVYSCLQDALEDIRNEKISVNDEQHLRALLKQRFQWHLLSKLKNERRDRHRCVSLESLEHVEPTNRSSLEGDIEFAETLAVAMEAMQNENPKMHEVITCVQQGMKVRAIAEKTGIPPSTVGELRLKGLAKLRLFFEST
ncbi:sigma-70 family RNA polymerase sigma factor [Rhodopirellula sp. JC740]|uniref:Sigma-70 family RNA polymerase sigma factor n=1 Tax=Rhodopirellula halodulae TaxID=2894198 RepID=A0ABS8NDQ6_9BACT|nr:sigma-70 family RNA polymerase sigma factor [Rhodopirellula sp. JC740]MCC9641686.1 sigma-70 family RNA polymerase sigma factor [Rhodopirellula sp. JC740]